MESSEDRESVYFDPKGCLWPLLRTTGQRTTHGVGHVEVLGDLMANPNPAQEPSMEEILASIRRIISDEDAPAAEPSGGEPAPSAKTGEADQMEATGEAMSQDDLDKLFDSDADTAIEEPEAAPSETEEEDILELTEEQAVSGDTAEKQEAGEEQPDPLEDGANDEDESEIAFVDSGEVDEAADNAAEFSEPDKLEIAAAVRAGTSEEVDRLVSPSVDTAVNSAFNSLANTVLMNNARTLEDLVKDMLRPMLKDWLDQNLPPLVERLVRQEIERVTRGR
ncbi:DUF2497 domain-containing protein [Stappia sediminis]|nr:DUF2497 domain-containing protein [Stappia sediminis]